MIEIKSTPKAGGTDVSMRARCDNGLIFCEEALAISQSLYENIIAEGEELAGIYLTELGELMMEWMNDITKEESETCGTNLAFFS